MDEKITVRKKTIILATIVIVTVVIFPTWYFFIREGDLSGRVEFSISLEKDVYQLNETINMTFQITNLENKTIEISEFYIGGSLYFHLWNSTGYEMNMLPYSVPGHQIRGVKLNSGEIYEITWPINQHFHNNYTTTRFHFIEGSYTFEAAYLNFHPYDGFDWDNFDSYSSNEIELTIVSP